MDIIHFNGLQILKYLYEKRKENIPFVRFIGKILLLLSREKQTHDAFYAVGLKIFFLLKIIRKYLFFVYRLGENSS